MLSGFSPMLWASSAEVMAEVISASYMTWRVSQGWARRLLASISSAMISWSSEPQFTPMRTALSYLAAISIIWPNCLSFFSPLPTLPGLMRYLDSASAQAG